MDTRRFSARCLWLVLAACCGTGWSPAAEPAATRLRFNKDVRPILVENCFSCHGADSGSRKADLRLDRRDDAIAFGALVPGDPDSSPMLDRIFSDDAAEVMPPPEAKKSLTAEQKEILRRWRSGRRGSAAAWRPARGRPGRRPAGGW